MPFQDSTIHLLKWLKKPIPEELTITTFKSSKRNIEKTAEHILLKSACLKPPLYLKSGKPTLEDQFISITHSHNFVAIYVHQSREIGVDIEKVQKKITRISHKFIRNDEHWATTDLAKTIIWSCKESVYKFYDIEGLDFKRHIKITPLNNNLYSAQIELESNGQEELYLKVTIFEDMVLTYTL